MNYDNYGGYGGNDFDSGNFGGEPASPTPVEFDGKKAKRSFSRVGFALAAFVLVSFVVSYALQILVLVLRPEWINSSICSFLISDIAFYVCALPVLWLILRGIEKKPPEKQKFGVGKWLIALVIGFGLLYIGNYIGNIFMTVLSNVVGYDYSNILNSVIDDDRLWLTAFFMVVVAPIGEEFVFRKLLIDRTRSYGALCSILVSGLAFGLMHGNFYQFFYTALLGIVLAYVYYSSGNIWLSIAIHAAVNFIGSILTTLMTRGIDLDAMQTDPEKAFEIMSDHPLQIMAISFYGLLTWALMGAAVVLLIVLRKKLRPVAVDGEIPKGQRIRTVLLNAGAIVALVCFAARFALFLIPT